jgi:hypothetical protein
VAFYDAQTKSDIIDGIFYNAAQKETIGYMCMSTLDTYLLNQLLYDVTKSTPLYDVWVDVHWYVVTLCT